MSGHAQGPARAVRPRRWMISMLAVAAVALALLMPAVTDASPASAATGSAVSPARSITDPGTAIRPATLDGFNAGNIISDAVFTNKSTMSAGQIQDFFNAKVPSCQGGYTCLKDFRVTSQNRPADAYCSGYAGTANETAASIIARVSQACNINPQALIVMLQKEQGLVTHTWPSKWRYDSALGQGCPDDAPCDSSFVGFFQQIYGAARQMQIYMEGRWFTWYAPGNTWNVLYNPNQGCGSGPVRIANKATAALYYYTPYQPNAAALRAGYGEGDGCSAYGNRNFYNYFTDWFGSTQSNGGADNPFGNIEAVQAGPGSITVAGWAMDPNTSAPIAVHVYVGPTGTAFAADSNRPDVAAAYPGKGAAHGYTATVPVTSAGDQNVCIYAMNQGPGANVLIGCRTVAALSGSPVGALDALKLSNGALQISGWAVDPDVAAPIAVHVYVDGVGRALLADQVRTDIPAAYAGYGTKHGYTTTVTVAAGTHTVCAYGLNVGVGGNVELGCKTTTATGNGASGQGRPPFGNFEAVSVAPGQLSAGGWAIDPDTADPITVKVSVDGAEASYTADWSRPDVAAAYPASGAKHGFSATVTASPGVHTVCAFAVDSATGDKVSLGCVQATVPATPTPTVDRGRVPFGNVEVVTGASGAVTVGGWALDPDTTDPISVHVYVDSAGAAYTADWSRPDVAAAYPGSGANHGFSARIDVAAGPHTVCVYAINNAAGGNVQLSCTAVTVN